MVMGFIKINGRKKKEKAKGVKEELIMESLTNQHKFLNKDVEIKSKKRGVHLIPAQQLSGGMYY